MTAAQSGSPIRLFKKPNTIGFLPMTKNRLPYGLAMRIPGFHPGGPSSTLGETVFFSLLPMVIHCFSVRSFFSILFHFISPFTGYRPIDPEVISDNMGCNFYPHLQLTICFFKSFVEGLNGRVVLTANV